MKHIYALFTLVLIYSNANSDSWVQKNDIGSTIINGSTSRSYAFAFSIGSKGYAGTGLYDIPKEDFWEYDPGTDIWTQKANFGGGPRYGAVGFSIGAKGYAGTGITTGTSYTNDFWEYDPLTNNWTSKAVFAGNSRAFGVGFSINSKGYVGTGYRFISNPGELFSDFWEFDPVANNWTVKASFTEGRFKCAGLSIGNKGYVGLGTGTGSPKKDFWEFDPLLNTWIVRTNFPGTERIAPVAFTIGSLGYVGTGLNGSTYFATLYEFNPSSNSWLQKMNVGGSAREGAFAFSIGTKGYVGTGNSADNPINYTLRSVNDFWEFNSTNNTWLEKRRFGGRDLYHTTGFSIGNKIYMGGGYGDTEYLSDFWEYDPATGLWTQKADIIGNARAKSTGFSIGNKGYIGTGESQLALYSNEFYEYDPVANTWTAKTPVGGLTRQVAASFVIGTKAYIGTGIGSNGSTQGDLWEYDQLTNAWTQKVGFGSTRAETIGFTLGGFGYMGMGYNNNATVYPHDLWKYNPVTNTWVPIGNAPGFPIDGTAWFTVGNKAYLCGGRIVSNNTFVNEVWEFNPNSFPQWIAKTAMPSTGRYHSLGISNSTHGYVGGGSTGTMLLHDFWEYKPDNQIYTTNAPTNICAGTQLALNFNVVDSFSQGNIFTAQLSNSSGNFSSPISIGTLNGRHSGTIQVTIPGNTSTGSFYKIRIISSAPSLVGEGNLPIVITDLKRKIFNETIGTISSSTIAVHESNNRFDNDSYTMTGTGGINSSTASTGYTNASGGLNIDLNGILSENFQIAGIITTGTTNLILKFGAYLASLGTEPIVEYSTDGVSYNAITVDYPGNSNSWQEAKSTSAIPATANLRLRFRTNGLSHTVIDDIKLICSTTPDISAAGPTNLCGGGTVVLNALPANTYLWSNGNTTNSITVSTSGNYFCTMGFESSCTIPSNIIPVNINPVPTLYNVSGGGNYCAGGSGVTINLSQSDVGTSYQLLVGGNNSGVPVTGNSSPIIFGPLTAAGNYTVLATNGGGCTSTMTGSATVTINPTPIWYKDFDGDGYGTAAIVQQSCTQPATYVNNSADCNDQIFTIHPGGTEVCNGLDDNCNGNSDESLDCVSNLSLKVFIEGFYNGGGIMNASIDPIVHPTVCDTITVDFHNSTFPFALSHSVKSTIGTNGIGLFVNPPIAKGHQYYIAVRHRNSIETWSSTPLFFNPTTVNYIFTDAITKAFGSNQIALGDGNFAIFSGDCSHASLGRGYQDGIVESQDYSDLENAVTITLIGYEPEDITGDRIVESYDYSLMENNVFRVVFLIHP